MIFAVPDISGTEPSGLEQDVEQLRKFPYLLGNHQCNEEITHHISPPSFGAMLEDD
jgi:hypothetical protein